MRLPGYRPAAALLLLACSLFAQSTVPPNLVGQWHLDEGTGTTTADSAAGGLNNGTLTGTVAWVPGIWGNAVQPDGTTGYVNVGSNAALNIGANMPFSISAWINVPPSETVGPIVSMRHSTNDNPVIDLCVGFDGVATTAGGVRALVRDDAGGMYAEVISASPLVNDGMWHHVALTRNAGNTIELFVDGVSAGTNSAAGSGGAITTDWRYFGAEPRWIAPTPVNTADQRFLNGTIEEVQFYTRQLSLADVQTLAAPAAPTGLGATAGNGTVNLTWTASPNGSSYVVKRGTAMAGPFTALPGGTTSGTTFSDTTATNGTTWYYVVDAVQGALTSTDSNVASATPQAPAPRTQKLGSDHKPCGCSTIPPIQGIPYAVWALLASAFLVLVSRRRA